MNVLSTFYGVLLTAAPSGWGATGKGATNPIAHSKKSGACLRGSPARLSREKTGAIAEQKASGWEVSLKPRRIEQKGGFRKKMGITSSFALESILPILSAVLEGI